MIIAANPFYFNSSNIWAISMGITWCMKSFHHLTMLMDNLVSLHTHCMIVKENYEMIDHKSIERNEVRSHDSGYERNDKFAALDLYDVEVSSNKFDNYGSPVSVEIKPNSRVILMGDFVNHDFIQDLVFGFTGPWNISRTTSIRIFGVSLEKINESEIRENVTSLSEEPLLIHGDIRSNMVHYSGTTDENVISLMLYLKLHEVLPKALLSLPKKLNPEVPGKDSKQPLTPPKNFDFPSSLKTIFL